MKKINDQIMKNYLSITSYLERLKDEEKGSFGIKEIAGTVAVVIIIGIGVTLVNGKLSGWIDIIWNIFVDKINDISV